MVGSTHVLFIIHLPIHVATKFVGFLGEPWISTHIDDLRTPTDMTLTLVQAINTPISELFYRQHLQVETAAEIQDEREVDVRCSSDSSVPGTSTEGNSDSEELSTTGKGVSSDENEKFGATLSVPEAVVSGALQGTFIDTVQPLPNDTRLANKDSSCDLMSTTVHSDVLGEALRCTMKGRKSALHLGFCCNLYRCIQAAASKLQDSDKQRITRRVPILAALIPQKVPTVIGKLYMCMHCTLRLVLESFCCALQMPLHSTAYW